MLGKLMKYEIKATGRTLIPLYIALLAFALINKIFIGAGLANEIRNLGSIAFVLSILAYGFTMAAVFIVTFFVIIQRFYKNLLGDEGYLMNTLPVSTASNITSKISIATFWNIISGIVAIISIIIIAFDANAFAKFFNYFFNSISQSFSEIGVELYIIIIEIIISILVQLIKSVTMIYASMSIGHLFNKHRILSSFGAFIALNIISATISSVIGITFSHSNIISLLNNVESSWPVHVFLLGTIIFNLIFFAAYFAITHYILKNKLNLE
ncbi:ABC transporter permease [Clostridium saccharobutylicum]|uniref:ABC-2 family transporter protein n=1 Tax=Clostridium saccharobutylicum TaxID=169679 RepID=A0A1S8MR35_CLOSA|nr:ABC transporter permease [Clostridium saccharobutylicum]OOM06654.1 hypothetical protein CLOSAC_40820 [Clostridium saccharobutylicum]